MGLTGLTINAMALIAPGAFLWLTFQEQCLYGAPMAGCAMWVGLLAALLLCFATEQYLGAFGGHGSVSRPWVSDAVGIGS